MRQCYIFSKNLKTKNHHIAIVILNKCAFRLLILLPVNQFPAIISCRQMHIANVFGCLWFSSFLKHSTIVSTFRGFFQFSQCTQSSIRTHYHLHNVLWIPHTSLMGVKPKIATTERCRCDKRKQMIRQRCQWWSVLFCLFVCMLCAWNSSIKDPKMGLTNEWKLSKDQT